VVTPAGSKGYSSVTGTWTVPAVTASQRNAVAAQWIGLGGVATTDLLQMGTIEQIENGQATAAVFWEQLPAAAQDVMTVPIGSVVSVRIGQAADPSSEWNLTFTASTPGGETKTKTITVTLDSAYAQAIGTSAEWISEEPSNENGQLYPLANMGTVKYTAALADGQPLNSSGNQVQPVALVSGRNVLIAPSALGTDGNSFSTSVLSSGSLTVPGNGQNRLRPDSHSIFRQGGTPGGRWYIYRDGYYYILRW
jgi:hypothetical protein